MARTKTKVALIVGLAGTAVTAYLLYANIYEAYRAKDVPPAFGMFGAALVLLSLAVGALKKPVMGVLLFAAGAAFAVTMLKLGKARRADQMVSIEHDLAINKAAAAVCDGTPNAAASDTPVDGKRPILGAGLSPESREWFSGGTAWHDLPKPRTLAELQLVACTRINKETRASCYYEGKDGVGSYTISKYRRVDEITVRKAKTGEVLGVRSFEGGEPGTDCSKTLARANNSSESSRDVSGDPPSDKDETDFVRAFVEHPQ